MNTPDLFENSLSDAESASAPIIAQKLGLIVGTDLFVGFNPGVCECAVFEIEGIRNPECVHNLDANVFHFGGKITIFNRDRRLLQNMIMRIIKASPFADEDIADSNIIQLRVSGLDGCISGCKIEDIFPEGENETVETWTASVDMDVVFNCGSRLNLG